MTTIGPLAATGHLAIVTADRHDSIRTLVEREASSLLAYFVRRTDNPDDAADLLSDTLLVIWRRERSIPTDATEARIWMFGVARRVLSGHRRSNARRVALAVRLGEQLQTVVDNSSQMGVESGDTADAIRAAIADLPETDREIVRLVYWEGFTLAEVAQILAMRPATVRSRLARARTRLRSQLDS